MKRERERQKDLQIVERLRDISTDSREIETQIYI